MIIKRIVIIVTVFLLAVAGYLITRPLPDYVDTVETAGIEDPKVTSSSEDDGISQEIEYDLLVENDLFGIIAMERRRQRRESVERPEPEPEPEPAEPLNLDLLGTIAAGSGLARAIIQPKGESKQKIYRVGDAVKDAEIIDIARKRVLLSRDGIRYELTMDMTEAVEIEGEEVVLSAGDFRDSVVVAADGVIEVDRREVLEKGGGMFALMRQVQGNLQARPYMENGEAKGLQLKGVENVGVMQLAGIEEGDVVRSVNGQVISSVSKAMQVFRKARHLDELDVKILRGEEIIEQSYNFK